MSSSGQSLLTKWKNDRAIAHVAPLMGIMVLMTITQMAIQPLPFFRDHVSLPWWQRKPDYWMLAVQLVVIGGLIIWWWKHYEVKWSFKEFIIGAIFGAVGIGFWILPTQLYEWWGLTEDPESGWMKWLGIAKRDDGFNPSEVFESGSLSWWLMTLIRFLRACVIVAIAEEVCWRGFLMRFVNKPDGKYWKIPFGTHTWLAYGVSTVAFILIHGAVDRPMAFVFGTLVYVLCIWRKSLFGAIVMHGVANLIMGIYALQFGKYGLW